MRVYHDVEKVILICREKRAEDSNLIMIQNDSIWVKALEEHTESIQSNVDSLQAKLDALQAKTDLLYSVVETANDGVSNQLSAANYFLALIAVVMAIVGIGLGIYIGKKKREVDTMASTVESKKEAVEALAKIVDEKKENVDKIAKTTEDLDKKIHSDLSALYMELRKEETNALLDRLVLEPQDVANLCPIFCARDIDETGYVKLRTAYLKMKKMLGDPTHRDCVHDHSESFLVLFYQHFFYYAIKDDEISSDFANYYSEILSRAYKRDVIKSTKDLCKALSEETTKFDKETVLATYLKALNYSQYSGLTELKNIFEHNITPHTLLQNAIERCTADKIYLTLFDIIPPSECEVTSQK